MADIIARGMAANVASALAYKANLVGGKVPASELPSYVDDVIEAANYASLPNPGEEGKIYVTLNDNATYRWSGSTYVLISRPYEGAEVFLVVYDGVNASNTFAEISAAVAAGKLVMLKDARGGYNSSPLFAPLVTCNASLIAFGIDRNGFSYYMTVSTSNSWNRGTWELQKLINSTNKLSADFINNGTSKIVVPAPPSDASSKTYTLQTINGSVAWGELIDWDGSVT